MTLLLEKVSNGHVKAVSNHTTEISAAKVVADNAMDVFHSEASDLASSLTTSLTATMHKVQATILGVESGYGG
jgi:gamma-glutamyl phosphate reductase